MITNHYGSAARRSTGETIQCHWCTLLNPESYGGSKSCQNIGEIQIASSSYPRVTMELEYRVRLPPHSQIRVHSTRVMTVFEENPNPLPLSLPWSVSRPVPRQGVFISSPNISTSACLQHAQTSQYSVCVHNKTLCVKPLRALF